MNTPKKKPRHKAVAQIATPAAPQKTGKGLHPRNLHNSGYDFPALMDCLPALKAHVRPNPYGNLSIDFADPIAVKILNAALLKHHYQIDFWDIPPGFLCPPIPGRVDYLHHIADLLADGHKIPKGRKVKALDVGTGANAIYPLLGIQSYGWDFVGSDIDPLSIQNVEHIIELNPALKGRFEPRLQAEHRNVFHGIIQPDDRFDVTLCNPPFHASLADAVAGSQRKVKNLAANRAGKTNRQGEASQIAKPSKTVEPVLNFGGQKAELWCDGGERQFLQNMIRESSAFATQCLWFTSLVSKQENLKPCYAALEKAGTVTVKTIEMTQGNKITRLLAWSYLTEAQRGDVGKVSGLGSLRVTNSSGAAP